MLDFYVKFNGPSETPYFGGVWKVHVYLPPEYPYKSPSIGFMNRIFHPNIDERSGSVCLDVINQTWSPMFGELGRLFILTIFSIFFLLFLDLVNIFESFLPQLLRYPNPADPLNGEAASLHTDNIDRYNTRVREYVTKYASEEINLSASSANVASSLGSTGSIGSSGEENRKRSSTTDHSNEYHDSKISGNDNDGGKDDDQKESGDGDIDDGASDVSNMSDL